MLQPIPQESKFDSHDDFVAALKKWGNAQHQSAIAQCTEKEAVQKELGVAVDIINALIAILLLFMPLRALVLSVFELIYSEIVCPGVQMSEKIATIISNHLPTTPANLAAMEASFKARHPEFG